MNKKLKVAWFGKKSPFCGNVTYSREITNLLTSRGHEVSFFHFEDEKNNHKVSLPGANHKVHEEDYNEHEVIIPYIYKAQAYTIPSMSSAKVVSEALKEIKPDIVHASLALSPMDFRLPEICHEQEIPLVCTFHQAFDKRPSFYSGAAAVVYQLYSGPLAQYDGVIIFSDLQKFYMERLGVPAERIKVIPNGIDTERFSPGSSAFRDKFPGKQIYTYMGRLNPEKGLEDLLKAYTRSSLKNSHLVVVGGGPQENVLKAIYGEEENVTFTGFIKDENERIDILRGSDAFILPSQVEGLSLSLLEAMACGVPTIATDVGSDGEVLEDGAGIIIDPAKVKSQLSFALKLIHDSKDFRNLLSAKARERVVERYSLEKNIESVEALYYECLEKQRVKISVRH